VAFRVEVDGALRLGSTVKRVGVIEVVRHAKTIVQIQNMGVTTKKWIRDQNRSDEDYD
jgi:hypothetical protein